MAQTSIGALNVKVMADGKQFFNELAKAEKGMMAFAAKAASPLTIATGFGAGIGAAFSGSAEAFLKPVSDLVSLIAGKGMGDLIDPAKSAAKFADFGSEMKDLGRESRKLGFDPQFLQAIKTLSGPDADTALMGLNKMMATIGKGGPEMEATLSKFGLSLKDLRASTPEELFSKIAEGYASLDDPLAKIEMRQTLAGRSSAALDKAFTAGGEGVAKYAEHLNELNIGTAKQIAMAETLALLEREHKEHLKGFTGEAFERYGSARQIFAQKREAAPLFSSAFLHAFAGEMDTYISALTGGRTDVPFGFGGEQIEKRLAAMSKPKPSAAELASRAADADRLAALEANKGVLDGINGALDEQDKLLRYTQDGWKGFEKQLLAIDRAINANPELLGRGQELIARLGRDRDEKIVGDFESKIRNKLAGLKATGGEFAPVDLANSANAAAAFNRQWTSGGGGDLVTSVEQILELMKSPRVNEQLQSNVREAARKLADLADKLGPIGPVQ